MAEYKGIKGFKVQYLDQDPVPAVAGWSSGGNMNTARSQFSRSRYTNCRISFWWLYYQVTAATEEYNGSTWTTVSSAEYSKTRFYQGQELQTAALAFGGLPPLLQEQQKNIMEQLGQLSPNRFNTSRVTI
jgi:hypothetical protein